MERKGGGLASSRLKREECKRTKHDSIFSKWKILIGPSDWENYSLGKEGTERYRTHNLTVSCSCPGLYELGIAISITDVDDRAGDGGGGGRRSLRELDPDRIVVVYLGQADNVRTRLQHYGRAGSHLGHGNWGNWVGRSDQEDKGPCLPSEGPGLFQEIFSGGFPIVFRWAPMENKKEAQRTEALLLGVFDYAWNKGGNGARRPNDILVKLDRRYSKTTPLLNVARKLQEWKRHHLFPHKQMGISIKASQPALEAESITCSDQKTDNLLSWVFKFGQYTRPPFLMQECSDNEDHSNICGVAIGDGSICRNKPIEGRKRCGQHKGKRVNGSIFKLVTERKSHIHDAGLDGGPICLEAPALERSDTSICGVALGDGSQIHGAGLDGRSVSLEIPLHERGETSGYSKLENLHSQNFTLERLQPSLMMEKNSLNEDYTLCGVILGDGSVCRSKPVKGRKRCAQHKGMRISTSISKSLLKGKSCAYDLGLEIGSGNKEASLYGSKINNSGDWELDDLCPQVIKHDRLRPWLVTERCGALENYNTICGVAIGDGSICRNKPIEGRKRCGQHKGERVNGSIFKLVTERKSHIHDAGLDGGPFCLEAPALERSDTSICGVALGDGSQIHGAGLDGRSVSLEIPLHERGETSGYSKLENLHSQNFSLERLQPSLMMEKNSLNEDYTLCGVILGDGSVCRSKPVKGRKRCAQHKGMRISTSISKSLLKGKSCAYDLGLEIGSGNKEASLYGSKINNSGDWELDDLCPQVIKHDRLRPWLVTERCGALENYNTICGVAFGDGSVCRNKPVQGRKRCEEHKGKRTNGSISKVW